jgi:UDP-N-acetylmuramate dehydrogenase
MNPLIKELERLNVGRILVDEPLSNHTTWRIGGPADIMIIPESREKLIASMKVVHAHRLPWRAIGLGSNLLVGDKGIRGVVFKLSHALNGLSFDGNQIYAEAGYSMVRLSVLAGKAGLTGLEFAGGIPGTVGGAVFMNAGAHGSDVSRVLTHAEVLYETGELKTFSNAEMGFKYRTSRVQHESGLIIAAVFQLERGDRQAIAQKMAEYKLRRKTTQPLNLHCAGSVFRNPPGDYAARLIEACGLKGYRIGGAKVSDMHANFIVNIDDASASDVRCLIRTIQEKVAEQFSVHLVPEVEMIGEE